MSKRKFESVTSGSVGNSKSSTYETPVIIGKILAALKRESNIKKIDVCATEPIINEIIQQGLDLQEEGLSERARNFFFSALSEFEKNNNYIGKAQCFNYIGLTYQEEKDFTLAYQLFKQALKIYENENKQADLKNNYELLAKCASLEGNTIVPYNNC